MATLHLEAKIYSPKTELAKFLRQLNVAPDANPDRLKAAVSDCKLFGFVEVNENNISDLLVYAWGEIPV